MKAERIYISDFEFLTIKSLEMEQQPGEHAAVRITGCIRDEDVENYRRLVLEDIWVNVTAEEEGGEKKILLTGTIAGFCFARAGHDSLLTLDLRSGSWLMDRLCHFRSFQNGMQSYMDIFRLLNCSYGLSGVMGEPCAGTALAGFALQYQESDWMFVKRLASRLGLFVTPEPSREGIFYYVGKVKSSVYKLPSHVNLCVRKDVGKFMEEGANGNGPLTEEAYVRYGLRTRQLYDLWDVLLHDTGGGCVCRIQSEYVKGELWNTYTLCPPEAMKAREQWNVCQTGCSFRGTITDVRRDQVRLLLVGDENSDGRQDTWFPYATAYSSPAGPGWYCMPEIGDEVRLQIPDCMEEHGYVMNAVHKETDAGRSNPDHKSFRTRFGKELLFTPSSLELTNHKGMSIEIRMGKGYGSQAVKTYPLHHRAM